MKLTTLLLFINGCFVAFAIGWFIGDIKFKEAESQKAVECPAQVYIEKYPANVRCYEYDKQGNIFCQSLMNEAKK